MSKISLELDVDMKTLRFFLYEYYGNLEEILEYTDEQVINKVQKKIENLLYKKYNKVTEDVMMKTSDRELVNKFIDFLLEEKNKEERWCLKWAMYILLVTLISVKVIKTY